MEDEFAMPPAGVLRRRSPLADGLLDPLLGVEARRRSGRRSPGQMFGAVQIPAERAMSATVSCRAAGRPALAVRRLRSVGEPAWSNFSPLS